MASNPLSNQPPIIIVRKRRKGGHGAHHASAWKVAYADFVTALMAFFMLLWLISAADEDLKKGLSDYFSLATEDASAPAAQSQSKAGAGPQTKPAIVLSIPLGRSSNGDGRMGSQAQVPASTLVTQADELRVGLEKVPAVHQLRDNLLVRLAPDGIRIDLIDAAGHSMFASGTATLTPDARALLAAVAGRLGRDGARLAIEGHTDASGGNGDANWVLSAERAQAARRVLTENGVSVQRIAEVTGVAANKSATPDDPGRPENRRISLRLLAEPPAMPAELGLARRK